MKPGVKTKVLMLSATPVNNRFHSGSPCVAGADTKIRKIDCENRKRNVEGTAAKEEIRTAHSAA